MHRSKSKWLLPILAMMFVVLVNAKTLAKEPIIDMHLHAFAATHYGPQATAHCISDVIPAASERAEPFAATWQRQLTEPLCDEPVWSPASDALLMQETIQAMEKHNIFGVASGTAEYVARYMNAAPDRIYPGISFDSVSEQVTAEKLRHLHAEGRLDVLGELGFQYSGIEPSDPAVQPYWQLANELDIPVAIHIGTGPPGAVYIGSPEYRARLHSPLVLEETLVKYPELRVQIMHAGYPMLDDLLAVLYTHPQVYIDVGVIIWLLPREEFYRYLKTIVSAGYGSRVMFGSDQMIWPGVIEHSIRIIEEAPFLNAAQKRNIFYHNAARFLRLSDDEIARHHNAG